MRVERLPNNPIIRLDMSDTLAGNINGPSLIRVPDWLPTPLGRYYLYFAHHGGAFIRLAYADRLEGPWRIHEPGTLRLEQTPCLHHIASPDVHVDDQRREIRMYYHGPVPAGIDCMRDVFARFPMAGNQRTLVAASRDGLRFEAVSDETFGPSYMRAFVHDGWWYALGMFGMFFRSRDGLTRFERGPVRWDENMRHLAVRLRDDDGQTTLDVFYTNAGDCPEQVLWTPVRLTDDWHEWWPGPAVSVLRPEEPWEGAFEPVLPSRRGGIGYPVHQLRDPAVYEEHGTTYLLYSVAGEHGIAIARLIGPNTA